MENEREILQLKNAEEGHENLSASEILASRAVATCTSVEVNVNLVTRP